MVKPKFKIGDYLLAIGTHRYNITVKGTISQLIELSINGDEPLVRLIYVPKDGSQQFVGKTYTVFRDFAGLKKITKSELLAYLL
jgi:hypothetical protein